MSERSVFREIPYIVMILELILAYLYALDSFKPTYHVLYRGIVWSGAFSLGFFDLGLYGILPLLVTSLILNIYPYAIKGLRAISPDSVLAHVLLIFALPISITQASSLTWLPLLLSSILVLSKLEVNLTKVKLYVLLTLTIIECISLLQLITYMWNPENPLHIIALPYRTMLVSELDIGLFYVYREAYPALIVMALYVWLPPLILRLTSRRFKLNLRHRINLKNPCKPSGLSESDNAYMERLYITLLVLLSIALPLIPYLPSINPDFKPVSVDIRYYSEWLSKMLATDYRGAVEYAFYGVWNGNRVWSGNRPLYMLLLYGLTCLGIPKQMVLNFEAVFIAPFFTLAVYFAAKRLSGNSLYALLASLAGLLGFNMTVGMMAGFFAAWIALAPFYTCIMLVPDLRRDWWVLAGSIVASITTLYIHPWTWGLLMAVLTAHLATSILKSLRKRGLKLNRHLLTVLALNGIVDVLKTATSPRYGGVVESYATLVAGVQSSWFNNLLNQPWNLHRLSISYVGGLFFNPLHIILTLIGILSLLKRRNELSKLILIWVIITSVVFPFSTIWLQSHLLFATPFPILIAEGLWALSRLLARFDSRLPRLLQAFFITSSLTYTVRALCNLI